MTSPTDRAGNKDRDAAIKTVEAALASGRIVQADRDKRVDELRRAQTMQDIQVQIGDLMPTAPLESAVIAPVAAMSTGIQGPPAPPTATPSSGSPFGAGGQQPWPLVSYGTPSAASTVAAVGAKAGRRIGGIVAAIILVSVVVPIVGAVIAFASARNSFDFGSVGSPSDDQTYLPGQAPGSHGVNLHTVDGFEKMVAALKQQTGGSTQVYSAVMYPRYAVLEVPDNTGPGHYQDFYYDGKSMALEDIKDKTDDPALDVAKIDPNVMINVLKTVRARVDNPTSWYCIAEADQQVPELSCYASNEYGDDSYQIVTTDGTLVYDSAQSQ